jgi:hypothetical protein
MRWLDGLISYHVKLIFYSPSHENNTWAKYNVGRIISYMLHYENMLKIFLFSYFEYCQFWAYDMPWSNNFFYRNQFYHTIVLDQPNANPLDATTHTSFHNIKFERKHVNCSIMVSKLIVNIIILITTLLPISISLPRVVCNIIMEHPKVIKSLALHANYKWQILS